MLKVFCIPRGSRAQFHKYFIQYKSPQKEILHYNLKNVAYWFFFLLIIPGTSRFCIRLVCFLLDKDWLYVKTAVMIAALPLRIRISWLKEKP